MSLDPRLQALADRIRELILASDYNPTEVAKHLRVDKSAVSRWMTGERTPTMKNLIDLADLLGVEVQEMWAGPESLPATPEQRAMLEKMARLTIEQQQAFLLMAETMLRRETP